MVETPDGLAKLQSGEMQVSEHEYLKLTREEFNRLPEYSWSLPTGTTIGKRWRREQVWDEEGQKKSRWWVGEYIVDPDPKMVGIKWYRVLIERDGMFV